MPVSVEIPGKTVIIDPDIKFILNAFNEAVKAHGITNLQASEPQIRKGIFYTKLVNTIEGFTGKELGGSSCTLGSIQVQLDPPAEILRKSYRNNLNELILTTLGLDSEHTESSKIENRFILVRELILRLVTVALSKDMDGNRDGDLLLKALEDFIRKINSNTSLYDKKYAFWKGKISSFNKLFATTHTEWLNLIKNMVTVVKLFHQNTTAMSESLTHLHKTKYFIKGHIVAQLDPNRKPTDLSTDWIDISLADCENKIYNESIKGSVNKDIVLRNFREANRKLKSELVSQATKSIIINAKTCNPEKIRALYELLAEADLLEKAINHLDYINTTTGWLLFMMNLVRINPLAERIQEHGTTCAVQLFIDYDDPILGTKAGEGLLTYGIASGCQLQISAMKSCDNLMNLRNSKILMQIAKSMEDTFNELLAMEPKLGFELLDKKRLAELTQGAFQLQDEIPKEDNNNYQKNLKSISESESDIQEIDEMLENVAYYTIKKAHENEIRIAAQKSKEPITTDFILEWALNNEKYSAKYVRTISHLQFLKAKEMSKLLNQYKQTKAVHSSSQIVKELKKQELKKLTQNTNPREQKEEISESKKTSEMQGRTTKLETYSPWMVKKNISKNSSLPSYKGKPTISQLAKKDAKITCLSVMSNDRLICGWYCGGIFPESYIQFGSISANNRIEELSTKKYNNMGASPSEVIALSENLVLITHNLAEKPGNWWVNKWNPSSQSELEELEGIRGGHLSVFLDKTFIISFGKSIIHRNLEKKDPLNIFNTEHSGSILTIATLSFDTFASGSEDETIRIWKKNCVSSLKILNGHTDAVTILKKISDNLLASASRDKTIRIWDTLTGECVYVLSGHIQNINAIIALPNNFLASADGNTIRIWNYQSGKFEQMILQHEKEISTLAVFPDGRLVSGDEEGHIYIMTFPELKPALENTPENEEEEKSEIRSQFH